MNELDLNLLKSRIGEIKKEAKDNSVFTFDYLTCLMRRHYLQHVIPDDYDFGDVPMTILEKLKSGEIPTEDEIMIMDVDTQTFLCFELVFLCGLYTISSYGGTESLHENEDSVFDVVREMRTLSPSHYLGTYIIAAMALIMGQIPYPEMIEKITNNYNNEEEELQKTMLHCSMLVSAVLTRYNEDLEHYQ